MSKRRRTGLSVRERERRVNQQAINEVNKRLKNTKCPSDISYLLETKNKLLGRTQRVPKVNVK